MKILRGFQVINKDGMRTISSTYNEVDAEGNIIRMNAKDSFVAIDSSLQGHLDAVEEYIMEHRLNDE